MSIHTPDNPERFQGASFSADLHIHTHNIIFLHQQSASTTNVRHNISRKSPAWMIDYWPSVPDRTRGTFSISAHTQHHQPSMARAESQDSKLTHVVLHQARLKSLQGSLKGLSCFSADLHIHVFLSRAQLHTGQVSRTEDRCQLRLCSCALQVLAGLRLHA